MKSFLLRMARGFHRMNAGGFVSTLFFSLQSKILINQNRKII